MSITKHLDREINILGAEAQALRGHGQEEEAKVLFNVCDRLRNVSIESKPKPARSASSVTSVCRPS